MSTSQTQEELFHDLGVQTIKGWCETKAKERSIELGAVGRSGKREAGNIWNKR
jgi:hypothetical protein